jgi:hypothetical protein
MPTGVQQYAEYTPGLPIMYDDAREDRPYDTAVCPRRSPGDTGGIMSKKLAILQSNYIPWKGCFGLVEDVDESVLCDTVPVTRNDRRYRSNTEAGGVGYASI